MAFSDRVRSAGGASCDLVTARPTGRVSRLCRGALRESLREELPRRMRTCGHGACSLRKARPIRCTIMPACARGNLGIAVWEGTGEGVGRGDNGSVGKARKRSVLRQRNPERISRRRFEDGIAYISDDRHAKLIVDMEERPDAGEYRRAPLIPARRLERKAMERSGAGNLEKYRSGLRRTGVARVR
jgi:hypothetical protein